MDPEFVKLLVENEVRLWWQKDYTQAQYAQAFLQDFAIPVGFLLIGMAWFFSYALETGFLSMYRSNAKVDIQPKTDINFNSVAGVDEAK